MGSTVLHSLSIREKQVYGALCLAKFCVMKKISHESINQLIEHLLLVLICDNLPAWEQEGANLELAGRGDPLPTRVAELLPEALKADLSRLVEYVVEIGISDMYGDSTEAPLRFLLGCIDILKAHGVDPPMFDEVFVAKNVDDKRTDWGKPLNSEEYEYINSIYRKIIGV